MTKLCERNLTRHASECYVLFAKIGKVLKSSPCDALEVISPHLYFHEPFSVKELEVMYDRVCDGWQPADCHVCGGKGWYMTTGSCSDCGGEGCPQCYGGVVRKQEQCELCGGTGKVEQRDG